MLFHSKSQRGGSEVRIIFPYARHADF